MFNIDKCKVMHFGYNNNLLDYQINLMRLQNVNEERDLSIIISDDLKWDEQCTAAVCQTS